MQTEIHAFDLDKTLINSNSSFKFGQFLYQKGYFSLTIMLQVVLAYAFHKIGFISISTLHNYSFRKIFHGKSVSQIEQYADEFAKTILPYKPCLNAMLSAQKRNHIVLIFSSSPDFLVHPISKQLGVVKSFATHYEIDKDSRFCKISSIMLGDLKAATVIQYAKEKKISLNGLTVYSDSHLDLPFLNAAGHRIGVNPDKRLRRICVKQNWPII